MSTPGANDWRTSLQYKENLKILSLRCRIFKILECKINFRLPEENIIFNSYHYHRIDASLREIKDIIGQPQAKSY